MARVLKWLPGGCASKIAPLLENSDTGIPFMKHLFAALVLTSGLAAVQANAACPYPVAPGKFPDGNQATKDEMLAAKSQVVKYNTEMDTYLGCIKTEFDTRLAENANASADDKAKMQSKQDENAQRGRQGSPRRDRTLQRTAARVEGKERRGEEELLIAARARAGTESYVAAYARPGRVTDRAAPRVPADRIVAAHAGRGRGAARKHLRRTRSASVRSRGDGWHRDRFHGRGSKTAGRLRVAGSQAAGDPPLDPRRKCRAASRS